jgi:hypothetical protein
LRRALSARARDDHSGLSRSRRVARVFSSPGNAQTGTARSATTAGV